MKYIKLFEDITTLVVPNREEIINSIEDIVIELRDSGIYVEWNVYFNDNYEYTLQVCFVNRYIYPNDSVKNRIEMIIDYMKLEWKDIMVRYKIEYIDNGSDAGKYTYKSNIYDENFNVPEWRNIYEIRLFISKVNKIIHKSPEKKKNFIQRFKNIFK